MTRLCLTIGVAALLPAAAATVAHADGLPVLGIDVGGVGVVAPSGSVRYVTIPAGGRTVLAAVRVRDGRIVTSKVLPGTFTIPAVAYDGSVGGLSGDGRTLVLIEPRRGFPRARTRLAVIEVGTTLRLRRTIALTGDFSFDAVSPRGSSIYLIEYTSPSDPTRYLVRAYDVRAHRLLARPITDSREPDEKMRGTPLSRASSADGRWAYTLYDGAGSTPFVHALDTRRGTARCIDLPALAGAGARPRGLRLDERRQTLVVLRERRSGAEIDTRSFRVRPPTSASQGVFRSGAGRSWGLIVVPAVGALALAAASLLVLRRRRRVPLPVE
jgi:hypothetical protein